jgi:hypothetical protein
MLSLEILLFDMIYLLFDIAMFLFVSLILHFLIELSLLCLFILLFGLLVVEFICIGYLFLNAVRLCVLVHYGIRLGHLLISFKVIIHVRFKYLMFRISLGLTFLFLVLCLHLIKFEMLISFLIELLFVQAVLFLTKFIILV